MLMEESEEYKACIMVLKQSKPINYGCAIFISDNPFTLKFTSYNELPANCLGIHHIHPEVFGKDMTVELKIKDNYLWVSCISGKTESTNYHYSKKDPNPIVLSKDITDHSWESLNIFDYDLNKYEKYDRWFLRMKICKTILENADFTKYDILACEIYNKHIPGKSFSFINECLEMFEDYYEIKRDNWSAYEHDSSEYDISDWDENDMSDWGDENDMNE